MFNIDFKPGRGHSYRSECKTCQSMKGRYARLKKKKLKTKRWLEPAQQQYQKEYYAKNKDKYVLNRQKIVARDPDYFRRKSRERKVRLKLEKQAAEGALLDKDCV